MPVAVHLGSPTMVNALPHSRVSHVNAFTTIPLAAPPLSSTQVATKRAFDLFGSMTALVLLLPVFSIVAIAIKATSSGPIFFRQRRLGQNSQEFRIWKFRTMTVQEDGPDIQQAKINDDRVTGVGYYLRRLNLDELPQLFNVITGEMSLVGPRPHPVALDKKFGGRIHRYWRRLNVKPGITGWAQVNGFRGGTETDEKMRARVECDLYYVDNWSIALDLQILARTIFSRKAFRNAY
jgi:exopolysaccharide biosynthesis polyprenyl glycosylphosphotransferase